MKTKVQKTEQVLAMFENGASISKIARRLRMKYSAVYYICKHKLSDVKNDDSVILDTTILDSITDMPEKIHFSMKLYGISIRVSRVPETIILEDNYLELN
jgi:hypothetical protein